MKIIQVYSKKIKSNESKDFAPFLINQFEELSKQTEIEILELNKGRSLKNIRENIKLIKEKTCRNSIIHSHFGGYFSAFIIFFTSSKNVIVSFGGTDLNGKIGKNLNSFFYNLCLGLVNYYVCKKSKYIIVKSENLLEKINSKFHFKTKIIPNGVDVKLFNERIESKDYDKTNNFTILFNLRRGEKIDTVKNFELALDAFNILKTKHPNTKLEKIINVNRSEMPNLLSSANCLLLTSLSEGSPNIIKEAMACNLPVVSVNCGDVKWLLQNVKNSYVSQKYDAHELSCLLEKVMTSRSRSNGREILMNLKLNQENQVKKIVKIYKSILKINFL